MRKRVSGAKHIEMKCVIFEAEVQEGPHTVIALPGVYTRTEVCLHLHPRLALKCLF